MPWKPTRHPTGHRSGIEKMYDSERRHAKREAIPRRERLKAFCFRSWSRNSSQQQKPARDGENLRQTAQAPPIRDDSGDPKQSPHQPYQLQRQCRSPNSLVEQQTRPSQKQDRAMNVGERHPCRKMVGNIRPFQHEVGVSQAQAAEAHHPRTRYNTTQSDQVRYPYLLRRKRILAPARVVATICALKYWGPTGIRTGEEIQELRFVWRWRPRPRGTDSRTPTNRRERLTSLTLPPGRTAPSSEISDTAAPPTPPQGGPSTRHNT